MFNVVLLFLEVEILPWLKVSVFFSRFSYFEAINFQNHSDFCQNSLFALSVFDFDNLFYFVLILRTRSLNIHRKFSPPCLSLKLFSGKNLIVFKVIFLHIKDHVIGWVS